MTIKKNWMETLKMQMPSSPSTKIRGISLPFPVHQHNQLHFDTAISPTFQSFLSNLFLPPSNLIKTDSPSHLINNTFFHTPPPHSPLTLIHSPSHHQSLISSSSLLSPIPTSMSSSSSKFSTLNSNLLNVAKVNSTNSSLSSTCSSLGKNFEQSENVVEINCKNANFNEITSFSTNLSIASKNSSSSVPSNLFLKSDVQECPLDLSVRSPTKLNNKNDEINSPDTKKFKGNFLNIDKSEDISDKPLNLINTNIKSPSPLNQFNYKSFKSTTSPPSNTINSSSFTYKNIQNNIIINNVRENNFNSTSPSKQSYQTEINSSNEKNLIKTNLNNVKNGIETNNIPDTNSISNNKVNSTNGNSKVETNYTCTICSQVFSVQDRLTKHIASRHKKPNTDKNGINSTNSLGSQSSKNRRYCCSVCKREFGRSDMLTRHMRLHTGIKPYTCRVCSQVFSRSDHLSTHQRTHTGEKPYKCTHCPYAACRRDMITRHMRTHARYELPDSTQDQKEKANSTTNPPVTSTQSSNKRLLLGEKKVEKVIHVKNEEQTEPLSNFNLKLNSNNKRNSSFLINNTFVTQVNDVKINLNNTHFKDNTIKNKSVFNGVKDDENNMNNNHINSNDSNTNDDEKNNEDSNQSKTSENDSSSIDDKK